MDEKALIKRIDPKTGKLVIEGHIRQELDFQQYHDRLPALKQEIEDRGAQVKTKKDKLKELGTIEMSSDMKKLKATIEKLGKLTEIEKLKKDLVPLEEQLKALKEDYDEQVKLDEDFSKRKA